MFPIWNFYVITFNSYNYYTASIPMKDMLKRRYMNSYIGS